MHGVPTSEMKLNFGCGANHLKGWQNYDHEVNITEPLRWKSGTVEFIFAEHVVEHVYYEQAIGFFRECHRILKPGGVVRIAVPSVVQIALNATDAYCEFTRQFVKTKYGRSGNAQLRCAIENILFCHGHKAPWTVELLETTLFYSGFDLTMRQTPGQSEHPELVGVEGHGKVIGDEFNRIETVVVEATRTEGE